MAEQWRIELSDFFNRIDSAVQKQNQEAAELHEAVTHFLFNTVRPALREIQQAMESHGRDVRIDASTNINSVSFEIWHGNVREFAGSVEVDLEHGGVGVVYAPFDQKTGKFLSPRAEGVTSSRRSLGPSFRKGMPISAVRNGVIEAYQIVMPQIYLKN